MDRSDQRPIRTLRPRPWQRAAGIARAGLSTLAWLATLVVVGAVFIRLAIPAYHHHWLPWPMVALSEVGALMCGLGLVLWGIVGPQLLEGLREGLPVGRDEITMDSRGLRRNRLRIGRRYQDGFDWPCVHGVALVPAQRRVLIKVAPIGVLPLTTMGTQSQQTALAAEIRRQLADRESERPRTTDGPRPPGRIGMPPAIFDGWTAQASRPDTFVLTLDPPLGGRPAGRALAWFAGAGVALLPLNPQTGLDRRVADALGAVDLPVIWLGACLVATPLLWRGCRSLLDRSGEVSAVQVSPELLVMGRVARHRGALHRGALHRGAWADPVWTVPPQPWARLELDRVERGSLRERLRALDAEGQRRTLLTERPGTLGLARELADWLVRHGDTPLADLTRIPVPRAIRSRR